MLLAPIPGGVLAHAPGGAAAVDDCYTTCFYVDGEFQPSRGGLCSLAVGATTQPFIDWIGPDPGWHTLRAVADFGSAVSERDETNNEREEQHIVPP